MPKQLRNISKRTFKKSKKRLYLAPKMVKMTLPVGQFLTKNFDFRGQIWTFQAEITPKVRLLRPKIMPKQLRNISKITFKTPKNGLFDPENGQNNLLRGPIFDQKF